MKGFKLKFEKENFSLFELLLMALFLLVSIIFHEKPGPKDMISSSLPPSKGDTQSTPFHKAQTNATQFNATKSNATTTKATETLKANATLTGLKKPGPYENLARRNPFTPEGSYSEVAIPENPYTLIAIKLGPPHQALLKLFTGEIITVKEKDKLLDGARVIKIKEKSVIIKRLNKERELHLFNIEVDKWRPKKSF